MRILRSLFYTVCFGLFAAHWLPQVSAEPLVFTLDSTQSQITLSGMVFGSVFTPQGSNSLTANYSGTINADLTGTSIQFTGGSLVAAETNGIWQPAPGGAMGSAPADYGATNNALLGIGITGVPGNFALRNLLLDLTSPQLPTTNATFDGSALTFICITNTASIDYYYASAATTTNSGTAFLNGYSTNSISTGASVSTNLGTITLILQVNATFTNTLLGIPRALVANLSGQLVATAAQPIPPAAPVITSIVKTPPNIVITTQNTTAQSVLLVSTNLSVWAATSAVISTNSSGMIVFTTPINAINSFYRLLQ
jgi:hypothetical protein